MEALTLSQNITLACPAKSDGPAVHSLISRCPPLDENSLYCNLLQCTHFAGTSVIAKRDDKVVGFISGYLTGDDDQTLFIWQVAVDKTARGEGLAKKMLRHILSRPTCAKVRHLHTTITPDNDASWGLFRSFAKEVGASISSEPFFDQNRHFNGAHETENLVDIGPFDPVNLTETGVLNAG